MKFELPYNFEKCYIKKLKEHAEAFTDIEFIYLPAWKNDCLTTRQDVQFRGDYPESYDEYCRRIAELSELKISLCILMQRKANLELVEKYYALGIKKFIINDDTLAVDMKKKHDDIWVALSVTRALTYEDICDELHDYSMYDCIVLFYWFGRHLDFVKKLPRKYKYTIMCNNDCYWNCKWHDQHWFAQADSIDEYYIKTQEACSKCLEFHREFRDSSAIAPEDLVYFEPYVNGYKLLDRTWPTDEIINDFLKYRSQCKGTEPIHSESFYNIEE